MTQTQKNLIPISRIEWLISMTLCTAIIAVWTLEQLFRTPQAGTGTFAPEWLPLAASLIAAAGIIRLNAHVQWFHFHQALRYIGLFLLVWTANGLPLDLLRLTPLMPFPIYWLGVVIKTIALATAIMFLRFSLIREDTTGSTQVATLYGYAAFVLALPYPVLRTIWAFGGMLGLMSPGAAGEGFIPWLASIPWLFAAICTQL